MSKALSANEETSRALRIDRMSEHDLLEVVEIEEASRLSCWGWNAYHTELRDGQGGLMLVVRRPPSDDGKNLAAFVVSRLVADELHVNNIAVRNEYRRRGIGKALLNKVLKLGIGVGATIAVLEVRDSNKSAQALYGECGFQVVGRRKGYYSDPIEDALIMRATLGSAA